MLSHYKIITLSHQHTNLRDLAKFVLPELEQTIVHLLHSAKENFNIQELFYVSTCNRVMFLLYGELMPMKTLSFLFTVTFFLN